jgi:hypothetical protein
MNVDNDFITHHKPLWEERRRQQLVKCLEHVYLEVGIDELMNDWYLLSEKITEKENKRK